MSDIPVKEVIKISQSRDGLQIAEHGIAVKPLKKKPKPPKSLGRPKGSLNKVNSTLKLILAENGEKVLKKIINKALKDDDKDQAAMLKLLVERLMPATKAVDITSTHKEEQNITISVEGVEVHNGQVIEAEIVEFIEHESKEEDDS